MAIGEAVGGEGGGTAAGTIRSWLAAMETRDFERASRFIDPGSIEHFQEEWTEVFARVVAGTDRHSGDGERALSTQDGTADPAALDAVAFLQFVWARQSMRYSQDLTRLVRSQVIGQVNEGRNRAYVLLRHADDAGSHVPVSLIALNRTKAGWRILLTDILTLTSGVSAQAF